MRSLRSTLLAAALVSCAGGSASGTYLQFENVFTLADGSLGNARLMSFRDRLFADFETSCAEYKDGVTVPLNNLRSLVVLQDALYALQADGTVAQSTDGSTFTPVASVEKFTVLGAVDTRLIALRRVGFAEGTVHASSDKGLTWSQLGSIDAGFKVGNFEDLHIGRAAGDRLRLSANVADNQGGQGNTNFASQTFELKGTTLTLVGALRGTNPIFAPPFPSEITADGLAVFVEKDESNLPVDAVSLVLMTNPGSTPDLQTGRRVHWASPLLTDQFTVVQPVGLDSQGRLVVAVGTRLLRTVRPLKASLDDRAVILKGPGCGRRLDFDPDKGSNPRSENVVKNATNKAVLLRYVDAQLRFQRLGILMPQESKDLKQTPVNVTYGVLASDASDDTCLLFQQATEKGTIEIR